MIIPRAERELAGKAAKHEPSPRRRVMLRLFSEGRSTAEIADELFKQGLLMRSDEKKVKDELKACMDRLKAEKRIATFAPPVVPEAGTGEA